MLVLPFPSLCSAFLSLLNFCSSSLHLHRCHVIIGQMWMLWLIYVCVYFFKTRVEFFYPNVTKQPCCLPLNVNRINVPSNNWWRQQGFATPLYSSLVAFGHEVGKEVLIRNTKAFQVCRPANKHTQLCLSLKDDSLVLFSLLWTRLGEMAKSCLKTERWSFFIYNEVCTWYVASISKKERKWTNWTRSKTRQVLQIE